MIIEAYAIGSIHQQSIYGSGRIHAQEIDSWAALATTTSLATELCGIEEMNGKINVGYEADLIAILDNPTKDAKALQDVIMVMSNGNLSLMRLPFGK
jgi:imidazolonepropionase-like amidohydrolase